MHLFDSTDPGVVAARPKFYATIVVLSVATYAIAALGYWLVRNRKGSRTTSEVSNINSKQTGCVINNSKSSNDQYQGKISTGRLKRKHVSFGFLERQKESGKKMPPGGEVGV